MHEETITRHLDQQLLMITQHLIENPGLHKSIKYRIDEIVDIPKKITIESGELFAIMSSAFSIQKSKRKEFFKKHPTVQDYMDTLGPNRLQYAMLVFNFLLQIEELVISIYCQFLKRNFNPQSLMDLYLETELFVIKKAIFIAADEALRSKIIIYDDDKRIKELRHVVGKDRLEDLL